MRLGEVLRRVERFEPREEFTEYPFAGTYSFARGIFVGERKLGSSFALPKIQRIRAGDFIYCKIMAWEGAFGIAPKETDMKLAVPLYKRQIDAAGKLRQNLQQWQKSDAALVALHKKFPGFTPEACLLKSVAVNAIYGTNVLAIVRVARWCWCRGCTWH